MAKQILVLSSRRLLLLKHHSGRPGHLEEQLVGANQQQLRVISTWNPLCQQLGVTTAGRRFKSAAPPLAVETVDPCQLEDLPIEVINRKKDVLDLSFEVRMKVKVHGDLKIDGRIYQNQATFKCFLILTIKYIFSRTTVLHSNPRQHGKFWGLWWFSKFVE